MPQPAKLSFTNEIVLKFLDHVDNFQREEIIRSFNLEFKEMTNSYETYAVSKYTDVLSVANRLYETGFFELAYPHIVAYIIFFRNAYTDYASSEYELSPDTLFGAFIRSQNDTLLCFNILPDSLGLDIRELNDGAYPFYGDSISFNSMDVKEKDMEYYEIASPSEKFPAAKYRQIVITDIIKR